MERVIIFMAQLFITIIGLVGWSIQAGDGRDSEASMH